MRFLLTAFLFISAVVVFTLVAKFVYQGSVETELEKQAVAALKSAGFESVVVEFDHHEASLSGFVNSRAEIEAAHVLVQEAVPVARLQDPGLSGIQIRPTVPPQLSVEATAEGDEIQISGVLGADAGSVSALLGSRLSALSGQTVDHRVESDPKRLPFDAAPHFAAVTAELLRHSGTAASSFDGDTLILEGTVPNDGVKEGILELAGLLNPGSLEDKISVVDPRSFLRKSTLVLTRNRFGMTLSGHAVEEEGAADIPGILLAAFPELTVNDRRTIADDRVAAPWEAHAAVVLPALVSHLHGEMTVEFGENQVRLDGVTANREDREKILEAIRPILEENPDVEVLADVTIEDPPERSGPPTFLSVTYLEGLLSLEGRVIDDRFVKPLEDALLEIDPDLLVKNALEVDEGAVPAGWVQNLQAFLIEALPRIEQGTFHFTDSRVKLEGTTAEITDKAILQNVAINTVPSGVSIENLLMHPDEPFPTPELLPEARAKLEESLKQYPIYFDSNSEIVNETGREKIKAIATLLKETGAEVRLVATGFADNVGNAEYNRQLSLRRAAAVVEGLTALEIPPESLTTESKGEDVSRVSSSERWKARRVEISLAPEPSTPESAE